MDIPIVMMGVGIIALAGILVRKGILIVAFIDQLLNERLDLTERLCRQVMNG